MDVFGAAWARAWMVEINSDPSYREAGRGWHGAIVLRMWPEGAQSGRSMYVDLQDGECLAARVASDADSASAPYVIGAPFDTWRAVLEGAIDPILGLLQGRLRLERGNLLKLVPYARAAKVLLSAASRVTASFPGESNGPGDAAAATAAAPSSSRGGAMGVAVPDSEVAGAMPGAGGSGRGTDRLARAHRLDGSSYPMRLWQEAKQLGIWNPGDIGLATDREDWSRLPEPERDLLLRLAVQFRGGETALVTHVPVLMNVLAAEHRLEEQLYLTSVLWEEGKHVEMFDRFLAEVTPARTDLERFESTAWRRVFGERFPADMDALRMDASPAAQVRAAVTCNLVIEGILAETGYHGYHLILEQSGILPGMQRAMQYIRRDESRHVAWGMYLIGRLVAEHGDSLWKLAESSLADLLEPCLDIVRDVFAAYDTMPFGLRLGTFLDHAMASFRNRLSRLEATRHASLHELLQNGAG